VKDKIADEPIESLQNNVLYLFNHSLFHLGFGYIKKLKRRTYCRLIFYIPNKEKIVNTRCNTIQEAKIELMTFLKDSPFLAICDPLWHPLDAPQIPQWKENMRFVKNMKDKSRKKTSREKTRD
jgi:hypothetical protein